LDKLPAEFNDYAGRIREIFKSKGVLAMDWTHAGVSAPEARHAYPIVESGTTVAE
jgi:hypothetical protein